MPLAQVIAPEYLQPSASRTVPVTLIREKGYVGSRMGTVAIVDNEPIVLLSRKQKLQVYLAPGQHVFAMGYAKHLETRPLIQSSISVAAERPLVVYFHLILGEEPRFLVAAGEQLDTVRTEYTLDICRSASVADDFTCCEAETAVPTWVDGAVCVATCAHAFPYQTEPGWSDLGNLEEYAEPDRVAEIVDSAIAKAGRRDWLRGNVGRAMDSKRRYVYTRAKGWIDLKHVISTASNPGAYIPGISWLASYGVEFAQVLVAPMSAFLEEDKVSNAIGASAAMHHLVGIGKQRTRGEIVQAKILSLQPMTFSEAMAEFGIAARRPIPAVCGKG